MTIRLIIFDVDGTLAQSSTNHLLPHVRQFFQLVFAKSCLETPQVAIATNQGGVGMRYWLEKRHIPKLFHYPTEDSITERLTGLLIQLGAPPDLPVYAAYRYMDKKGNWSPVPQGREADPRWAQNWRKPGPGMLKQAMADTGVPPTESLYVGDRDEDLGAAQAAGCAFCWAKDFFAQAWDCLRFDRLDQII